jgi:SAM-dependent methyltransferase
LHENEKDQSPAIDLFDGIDVDGEIAKLMRILEDDSSPATTAALQTQTAADVKKFGGHWFQRIDYPHLGFSSTSDHSNAYIDEGGLNTLGGRLASHHASVLRPYPKWVYIKPRLPDLRNKTVLDVGSSNGFFSFRFAELGAAKVTGMEILREQCESAQWSASILNRDEITFCNKDFLSDNSIAAHDVVFCSEVVNHFLFPFFGLARLVSLAKETLIFDTGAVTGPNPFLRIDTGWNTNDNRLVYHTYLFSDGLLLDYFRLLGIEAHRITRYVAPPEHYHIMYVIDTRGIAEQREKFPRYMRDTLAAMQMSVK